MLIDTSFNFLTMHRVKEVLDSMPVTKSNILHWHIVDSSSFPCGSATYPQLAAAGAYDPSAVYVSFNVETHDPQKQTPYQPLNP